MDLPTSACVSTRLVPVASFTATLSARVTSAALLGCLSLLGLNAVAARLGRDRHDLTPIAGFVMA